MGCAVGRERLDSVEVDIEADRPGDAVKQQLAIEYVIITLPDGADVDRAERHQRLLVGGKKSVPSR